MTKSRSIAISLAVYLVAFFVAALVYMQFPMYPVLVRLAVADVAATIVVFLSSVLYNNSSMYDPYWSVKPFVLAAFYLYHVPVSEASQYEVLTFLFVFLYGLRLTLNFYRGWPGMNHEDWRYQNFRDQFPKLYWIVSFSGIHFFPTVMVFLGCLPMVVIFSTPVILPILAAVGLVVLLFSVWLAFTADEQLRKFRSVPENAGKTISHGLWAHSRHPNYLGEILTWWGLFLIALSTGWDAWWTGAGALAITIMFVFISIPMMEKRTLNRREDYREYMKKTPFLIPLRWKKSNV
jgi:steroid 5-alpha reductase family enzyme